jgi:PAS domain S-box-containing protein
VLHHRWPHWRWENAPFHSTVEALGAQVAIFMALILLQRVQGSSGKLFLLAMGFLGMGLLDGFHAAMWPGNGFVFLHSLAGLVGGFFFALAWLPHFGSRLSEKEWIPWAVAAGSMLCGLWALLLPGTLPEMVHNGEFASAAKNINILACALFLAGALRFALDFHRSGSPEAYLFACMSLLFAVSGLTFQYSSIWNNGWWLWHLLRLIAFLLLLGFMVRQYLQVVSDLKLTITERKQAEKALRESEEKYRALFENATEAILVAQNGVFVFTNQKGKDLFGYSLEDLASRPLTDFFHEENREMVRDYHERRLKGEIFTDIYPIRVMTKSDDIKWVELNVTLFSWENNPATLCFISDISTRKQAVEALKESEERHRELVENAVLGIFQVTKGGKFLMVNQRMGSIFGYDSKQDFLGDVDNIAKLYVNPEERAIILQKIDEKGYIDGLTITFREKSGNPVFCNAYVRSIQRDGGKYIYEGMLEDVTDKKKMETQLHQAQKMEAMGLMAGGVAHDLNNILSGIVSYPELLLMDLPEDSPLRKPIKTMQESGMRAADVVEDLLTIARGVATGKEALNLNTLITEYLGSAEYEKLEKTHSFVSCRTELDPELLNMRGSPTHIKKILMNLVTNASEAIEDSGAVTISTVNRYLDEPLKGYEDVHTGEYVMLTVSDNGPGISPKDLDRIFEPFYTKKVMGRSGTGLGLAVVWNSVQDLNGYINVESSGKGAMFELYFPVTREEVAARDEEAPPENYLGHGEKILVVDDEERQREIASGILTRLGYNSETVSSGEEAIEYVKEHPVDLIVLDMVMPKGINGRKTYEEIIKIRPGQKAIIASGYAKTKKVDFAQELGAGKYIKKPYTLAKVGVAVKEELEK